jgi:hypothetical protein
MNPAITDRWRDTNDGHEVPALMRLKDNILSHPGYGRRSMEERPPSVRAGILVSCGPPGSAALTTSDLRARFLRFLSCPSITELVTGLTHAGDSSQWITWDSNGRMNLGAILTDDDQEAAPVAWARLLLPDPANTHYGSDPRLAELVIYVEPRIADGRPAPPADLATWYDRFVRALAVAGALAEFLTKDLGLPATDDPPAQAGVWLDTPHAMTELVDLQGMDILPGATPSTWFAGWAVADLDGKPLAELAQAWLTQMCDYTLRLDGYEEALATISATQAAPTGPQEPPSPQPASGPGPLAGLRARLTITRRAIFNWVNQPLRWLRQNITVTLIAGALLVAIVITVRSWPSNASPQQTGVAAVVSNPSIGGVPIYAFAGSTTPVDFLRYGTQLTIDCLQLVKPEYLYAHVATGQFGGRWIDAFNVSTPLGKDLRFLSPRRPSCGPPVPIETAQP